jgi:hypothetical protein
MSDLSIKKRPGMFARVRRLEREVNSTSDRWLGNRVDTLEVKTELIMKNNKRHMAYIDRLESKLHCLGAFTSIVVSLISVVGLILTYVMYAHLSSK